MCNCVVSAHVVVFVVGQHVCPCVPAPQYAGVSAASPGHAFYDLDADAGVTCGHQYIATQAAAGFKSPVYLGVNVHAPSTPFPSGATFPFHQWDYFAAVRVHSPRACVCVRGVCRQVVCVWYPGWIFVHLPWFQHAIFVYVCCSSTRAGCVCVCCIRGWTCGFPLLPPPPPPQTWAIEGPFSPSPADVAYGNTVRAHWLSLAHNGTAGPQWAPVAAHGTLTTALLDANGTTMAPNHKTHTCAALAALGIDARFWGIN